MSENGAMCVPLSAHSAAAILLCPEMPKGGGCRLCSVALLWRLKSSGFDCSAYQPRFQSWEWESRAGRRWNSARKQERRGFKSLLCNLASLEASKSLNVSTLFSLPRGQWKQWHQPKLVFSQFPVFLLPPGGGHTQGVTVMCSIRRAGVRGPPWSAPRKKMCYYKKLGNKEISLVLLTFCHLIPLWAWVSSKKEQGIYLQ